MLQSRARPDVEAPSALGDRLHAEQVATLFRNVAPGVIGAGLGNIGLELVLIHLGALGWRLAVLWALYMIGCVGGHLAILRAYREARPADGQWREWALAFTLMSFAEGLGWGWASVWLVGPGQFEAQMLVMVVTFAIAAGAVPAFGSYLPAFFAIFLPATIPYALFSPFATDPVERASAVLMPIFIVTMAVLGVRSNRNFKELVALRIRTSELAEGLREQKEIAEQANLAKSRFLAAASHDLRQPVHALGLFAGALRGIDLPAEGLRLVERIEASAEAMDNLFAALLDISKLEAGVVEPRRQSFAIQLLLDRVVRDHSAEAKAKGLALSAVRCSAIVDTDPVLMECVLRNLVSNAVRYTDRGRVLVGCRRRDGALLTQVWDTGRGIPEAQQQHVFEEYFQLGNTERDRAKGLGLGLAIVRRLTDLLDCPLDLVSQLGRGSCFSVAIPLSEGAAPGHEPQQPAHYGAQIGGLVVVIDDESAIRDAMSALLTGWGNEVIVADSGDDALMRLATCPARPDLIICDYRLRAGENGIETIERLRQEYNEQIPAMLITGDTAPDRLSEAQASGLLLLHKPVANSKLRAATVNLIASSQRSVNANELEPTAVRAGLLADPPSRPGSD